MQDEKDRWDDFNRVNELKKKYGKLAYILYGLKQIRPKLHTYNIRYKVNGKTHEGRYSFFFITNSSRVAGVSDIYYDVKLDDNKFEVLLCNISKKKDIIKSLYFLTMYDVSKVPGIYSYKTDNLKIKFVDVPKKPWCIDGEKLDTIDKKYEITIDNNLKMMIPKKNIEKLFAAHICPLWLE